MFLPCFLPRGSLQLQGGKLGGMGELGASARAPQADAAIPHHG